jgi:hypothetical protein
VKFFVVDLIMNPIEISSKSFKELEGKNAKIVYRKKTLKGLVTGVVFAALGDVGSPHSFYYQMESRSQDKLMKVGIQVPKSFAVLDNNLTDIEEY